MGTFKLIVDCLELTSILLQKLAELEEKISTSENKDFEKKDQ